MKRTIAMMAFSLALTVAAVQGSPAATGQPSPAAAPQQTQRYVVVNGNNVRLRFEPNLNSSWLHYDNGTPRHAAKGTRLKYLGQAGNFYYVQYQGYKVYISKDYSYIAEQTAASSSRQMSTTKTGKYYVVVNGVNVRLRTGPGTNYPYFTWDDGSPCYLPKGSYLGYIGQQGDFYKADYKGKVVYVSKKFSYITK